MSADLRDALRRWVRQRFEAGESYWLVTRPWKRSAGARPGGAAQLVPQGTAGDLAQRLSATLEILGERGALLQMAQAARAIAKPDAARRVAQLVLEQVE